MVLEGSKDRGYSYFCANIQIFVNFLLPGFELLRISNPRIVSQLIAVDLWMG